MDSTFPTVGAASPGARSTGAAASQAQDQAAAITSDFETFLKLLTAQIQNQDPLNPTPSDEFAVQLATFSSVEQQVKTNDLLTALGQEFGTMGMAQFAGWVGMEARAAAPAAFSGAPLWLSPNPAVGADAAELVVRDGSGREVDRMAVPASADPIGWTGATSAGGQLMHGTYTFELVSFQDGMPLASTPVEVYGRIVEVRGEEGATVLVLEGGGRVRAEDVTALREPGTT